MIAYHSYLSVFIYYICTDTNNRMISNHLRLSTNDKHIIRKSHRISLSSVYSPIQIYILRYNRTHYYIKIIHEIKPFAFHYYIFVCLSSDSKHFVTTIIKTPHVSENIKIWPRDSINEIGWGIPE